MPSVLSISAIFFALVSFQAYALPYDNALVERGTGVLGHSLSARTVGKTLSASCKARKSKSSGKKSSSKGSGKRDEIMPITVDKRAPITLWHVTSNADADSIMKGVKLGNQIGDYTPKGKPGFYTTENKQGAVDFCKAQSRGCEAVVEFHYNPSNAPGLKVVTFTKTSTETLEQWMDRDDDENPSHLGFYQYCEFSAWCTNGSKNGEAFPEILAGTGLDTADVIIGPITSHEMTTQYVFRSQLALQALGNPVAKHAVS